MQNQLTPAQQQNQLNMVYNYLLTHHATASMVACATGVPQKNICRYKRTLQQNGKLIELVKATCKQTGFKAWYLTANPQLFTSNNQILLF